MLADARARAPRPSISATARSKCRCPASTASSTTDNECLDSRARRSVFGPKAGSPRRPPASASTTPGNPPQAGRFPAARAAARLGDPAAAWPARRADQSQFSTARRVHVLSGQPLLSPRTADGDASTRSRRRASAVGQLVNVPPPPPAAGLRLPSHRRVLCRLSGAAPRARPGDRLRAAGNSPIDQRIARRRRPAQGVMSLSS